MLFDTNTIKFIKTGILIALTLSSPTGNVIAATVISIAIILCKLAKFKNSDLAKVLIVLNCVLAYCLDWNITFLFIAVLATLIVLHFKKLKENLLA